jgi:hypothetical protein
MEGLKANTFRKINGYAPIRDKDLRGKYLAAFIATLRKLQELPKMSGQ